MKLDLRKISQDRPEIGDRRYIIKIVVDFHQWPDEAIIIEEAIAQITEDYLGRLLWEEDLDDGETWIYVYSFDDELSWTEAKNLIKSVFESEGHPGSIPGSMRCFRQDSLEGGWKIVGDVEWFLFSISGDRRDPYSPDVDISMI